LLLLLLHRRRRRPSSFSFLQNAIVGIVDKEADLKLTDVYVSHSNPLTLL